MHKHSQTHMNKQNTYIYIDIHIGQDAHKHAHKHLHKHARPTLHVILLDTHTHIRTQTHI